MSQSCSAGAVARRSHPMSGSARTADSPTIDGTPAKLGALHAGGAGAAHPYVVGTDTVLRALTVAGECARANRARFEMLP